MRGKASNLQPLQDERAETTTWGWTGAKTLGATSRNLMLAPRTRFGHDKNGFCLGMLLRYLLLRITLGLQYHEPQPCPQVLSDLKIASSRTCRLSAHGNDG